MDNRINYIRLAEWAKIIQDVNSSGFSKSEWCRQHDIKVRHLYYWQKKVRDYALSHGEEALRKLIDNTAASTAAPPRLVQKNELDFYEIPLQSHRQELNNAINPDLFSESDTSASSTLSVEYKNFNLQVTDSTSEAILYKVLKVLSNV